MEKAEFKSEIILRAYSRVIALACVILVFSSCGSAKSGSIEQSSLFSSYQKSEGFYKDKNGLPAAIAAQWNSVYLVLTLKKNNIFEMGSAFLIRKETQPKKIKLYFMTNHHVVEDCPVGKPCSRSALLSNAKILIGASGAKPTAPENLMSPFTVERSIKNPDIAVLSVEVPLTTVVPAVLHIAQNCELKSDDLLYTIGFPNTTLRTASSAKPIEDQSTMTKRWSQGFYLSPLASNTNNDMNTEFWSATTVDSLNGDSGAPLLNTQGEVVGVMQKSASDASKQFAYDGHDWGFRRDWQSLAIRCELLTRLISRE